MSDKNTQHRTDKSSCNRVNQGLVCILIALGTMILTTFLNKLILFGAGEPSFILKFEFGATISSIILSVVAIVYTLIQSKQSESVTSKVVDASDLIKKHSGILSESVNGIEGQVENLKEMDIEGNLKQHMENFDLKLNQLEIIMNGRFDDVKSSLENYVEIFENMKSTDTIYKKEITKGDEEHLHFFVDSILKEQVGFNIFMYIVLKFYMQDLEEEHRRAFGAYIVNLTNELPKLGECTEFGIFKQTSRNSVLNISLMFNQLIDSMGMISKDGKLNIDINDAMKGYKMSSNKSMIMLDDTLDKIINNINTNR